VFAVNLTPRSIKDKYQRRRGIETVSWEPGCSYVVHGFLNPHEENMCRYVARSGGAVFTAALYEIMNSTKSAVHSVEICQV
jgi:hypothetical protein